MPDERRYDVVVLGGGSTGENVADRAVKGGLSAVVVEAELVGGDCSYWACMPSKALLRPGEALEGARAVAGSREAVGGRLAGDSVLSRRDSFASHWDDSGQVDWLAESGIDLIRGHGRLAGERLVEVETDSGQLTLVAGEAVVLATGSAPAIPPIPGLAEARPWTTKQATSADRAPESLAVIGGGAAGCELAQAWASLGSEVTIYETGPSLLGRYEPFVSELLEAAMGKAGIGVHKEAELRATSRTSGGVTVELADGSQATTTELLVATGRKPRNEDAGLEAVGLEPGSWLEVDDTMAVSKVPGSWLYAPGDANHRAMLTHQGKYQGRVCGDAIVARARGELDESPWGRHHATADHRAVPQVVFTSPQVATVGLTDEQARAAGHKVRSLDYPLGQVAGAGLLADGYEGRARLVVDDEARIVLGATFVGRDVAELLYSATVAVVGEVPLERLWHAVPAYPTVSEVWLRLLEAYGL